MKRTNDPYMLIDSEGFPLADAAGPLRFITFNSARDYARKISANEGDIIYVPKRYSAVRNGEIIG